MSFGTKKRSLSKFDVHSEDGRPTSPHDLDPNYPNFPLTHIEKSRDVSYRSVTIGL